MKNDVFRKLPVLTWGRSGFKTGQKMFWVTQCARQFKKVKRIRHPNSKNIENTENSMTLFNSKFETSQLELHRVIPSLSILELKKQSRFWSLNDLDQLIEPYWIRCLFQISIHYIFEFEVPKNNHKRLFQSLFKKIRHFFTVPN